MYDNFLEISNPIFSIIVVFVSIGISGHIYFGIGIKKTVRYLYCLCLVVLLGCQLYFLIEAAKYVPSSLFYVYDDSLTQDACINSGKGGKRPGDRMDIRYRNPCFCSGVSICKIRETGEIFNETSCPLDGSIECFDSLGNQISEFVDNSRNCKGGMSSLCSFKEPCFPCSRDRLPEFGGFRCASCTSEFQGQCNFVPGVGPYCYKSNSSKEVEACSTCCTDPEPLFINGKCY